MASITSKRFYMVDAVIANGQTSVDVDVTIDIDDETKAMLEREFNLDNGMWFQAIVPIVYHSAGDRVVPSLSVSNPSGNVVRVTLTVSAAVTADTTFKVVLVVPHSIII